MKRHYIIISAFLILAIAVIIISIYISKQSLRETFQAQKPQAQVTPSQPPVSSFTPTPRQEGFIETKRPEEKHLEEKPKEPELDLNQIPDDYFKEEDIEKKAVAEEELSLGEKKLNKQPPLPKLKELKNQGVIIY